MKFFTPIRFIRLQELTNEEAFRAATAEWERAAEDYASHLRRILPELPTGLKGLVDTATLHDSRVIGMWLEPRNRLKILLQDERDAAHVQTITYSLIDAPQIDSTALPEPYRSITVSWLYDEIGIVSDGASNGQAKVFTHDILLSNGWEMSLQFHRLAFTRHAALVPSVPESPDTRGFIPRSA